MLMTNVFVLQQNKSNLSLHSSRTFIYSNPLKVKRGKYWKKWASYVKFKPGFVPFCD